MEIKRKREELDPKQFADYIYKKFKKSDKEEIIIVNIGTDKCIGDSFAPMFGSYMQEKDLGFNVYGTLEEPIHAINLDKKIQEINKIHPNSFIVGIDASLVHKENELDKIIVKSKPIFPGRGVGKRLTPIGDVSICYTVCITNDHEPMLKMLNNVRLGNIYSSVKVTYEIFKQLKYELDKNIIRKWCS